MTGITNGLINEGLLHLCGLLSVSEEKDDQPYIRGVGLYRMTSNGIREWAVLNGMNAGRFTCFFGAPNIGDTYDSLKIAEALIEADSTLILKHIEIRVLDI
jgi:hypothetical protein